MTAKLDRVCDQLRIKLHGIDRRLEALKGNAMALSEKSQGVVESQLDRIEQRIYDSRISVDAANTRVKTWHDGKKAGFDARRESWKKERRFHQLNSRADDTEAYAIAVFELAAAAADEAAQAALQARLARNDANLASLPPLGQTRIWQCLRDPARRAADNRAEGTVTATLLGARTRYRPLATTTVACCRSSRPSRRRATANSGAGGGPATGASRPCSSREECRAGEPASRTSP